MMFVDPSTRQAVANQADREGKLTPDGNVFVGTIPASVPVSNTAVKWSGLKWTMILWPLPEDEHDRAALMMHECFHRIQDKLGVPMSSPPNDHLDSLRGRYLLQLEWRALAAALRATTNDRAPAVADALAFRGARHDEFPDRKANELALELNEGLAEYSGGRLSGRSATEHRWWLIRKLDQAPKLPTFVRSFAYVSGPAYGALLDERDPDWRKELSSSGDLGDLVARAWDVPTTADGETDIEARAARYDGDTLLRAETERDNERQKRLGRFRVAFLTAPVLHIPLRNARTSFNPDELIPLDDVGTVYPTLTLSDSWGVLTVTGGPGALLYNDWSAARVTAPTTTDPPHITGQGWTLDLAEGWHLERPEGVGTWTIRQKHTTP
jgi:hypothetical protein